MTKYNWLTETDKWVIKKKNVSSVHPKKKGINYTVVYFLHYLHPGKQGEQLVIYTFMLK